MEGLRVSGLISGMDTDAIVEAYMTSAKAPINRLNQQIEELNYEKTTYNNFITMITDVKNSMLSLKMESTFKSKTTTSSVETVASATASITTPPGTYTLKVDQVAEPAYATSIYTNKVVSQVGAGIKSFSPSFSPYDQLEGTHTVDIYTGSNYGYNDKWFAKDTFKGNLNETYMVNHADKADKTLVNGNGELTQDIKGDFTFVYNYNGEQKNFTISMDYKAGTSLNKLASDLDLEINAKLDALHGNNSQQTMKVTLNLDDNGFNFSFYDVDTQNEIEVLGFVDAADTGDPSDPSYVPTPTSKLIDDLEEKTIELIRRIGIEDRVFFSSFNWLSIFRVRQLAPEFRVGLLFDGLKLHGIGQKIHSAGLECYHPSFKLLDDEAVRELKENRVEINVWTVNEPDDMKQCLKWDIDGLITNEVERARILLDAE